MRRFYWLIIILFLLVASSIFVLASSVGEVPKVTKNSTDPITTVTPTPVNFEAYFAIFTRGTFRIFTDSRYHNLSSDVYIKSDTPNKVDVRKNGVTWGEFFATLPMSLKENCLTTGTGQEFCSNSSEKLKFYINKVEDPDALDKVISPGDRLLVSYGRESITTTQNQLERLDDL